MFYSKNSSVRFLILLLLFSTRLSAQIIQSVELEVVGKPSWQNVIPLDKNGLFLFVKTDQAKAKAVMFDGDLQKKWESDIFLDVERAPTSYTFDDDKITFLFRETSGMYYQVLMFDLKTGKYTNKGFELREYFDDQNYVFFNNKVFLAGATKEGAAFFAYDFESHEGRLIQTDIIGKVQVQEIKYDEVSGKIHSIWSVKEISYSNQKRKKGEFIKDAYLNMVVFDTTGMVLENIKIGQKSGNFPMTGKSVNLADGSQLVAGTYQAKSGDKGLFWASDMKSGGMNIRYTSFSQFIEGQPELSTQDIQMLLKDFKFLMHDPISNNSILTLGGVFYKPEYRSVTQQVYNPYDNFSPNRAFGRSSSRTQTVFTGINYPLGFIANISLSDQKLTANRIDIKQTSPQIRQPLSFNKAGSVAYCVRGNLATKNFNIGTKPILYKLSEEEQTVANQSFLPSFQEVKLWYDNFFIANGSKNKIEVLKLENKNNSSVKKRKKTQSSTFTQVRKTIYLTKIASGIFSQN